MDRLINEYLGSCLTSDDESKNKIYVLRKRGFSINISDDLKIKNNEFAWNLDKNMFVSLFNLPLEQMIERLYSMNSVNNFEVSYNDFLKWGDLFGSNKVYGEKVAITSLEPFVARFVRALALCGIFTCGSCDGWHSNKRKSRKLSVIFCDRYSQIWFRTLIKSDEELKDIDLDFKNNNNELYIEISDINRLEVYDKTDTLAEILYRKRRYFHTCKDHVKAFYKGYPKSNLNDNELFIMFTKGFEITKEAVYEKAAFRSKEQEQNLWYNLSDNSISSFIDSCLNAYKKN